MLRPLLLRLGLRGRPLLCRLFAGGLLLRLAQIFLLRPLLLRLGLRGRPLLRRLFAGGLLLRCTDGPLLRPLGRALRLGLRLCLRRLRLCLRRQRSRLRVGLRLCVPRRFLRSATYCIRSVSGLGGRPILGDPPLHLRLPLGLRRRRRCRPRLLPGLALRPSAGNHGSLVVGALLRERALLRLGGLRTLELRLRRSLALGFLQCTPRQTPLGLDPSLLGCRGRGRHGSGRWARLWRWRRPRTGTREGIV